MIEKLRKYGIRESLLKDLENFTNRYKVDEKVKNRVSEPKSFYYGIEVWEQCLYALLNGQNILLVGTKATGKNVLADNLAFAFGRPKWTVSFHNFLDADDLIGVDTYKDSKVTFRNGSITNCAVYGGFGVLDEINMAKNDAISVLYSALDYRRIIDISGYDKIDLQESTRFIATMNYGYFGTKELNEALVSRFAVIQMPDINHERTLEILRGSIDDVSDKNLELFAQIFVDLQEKAKNGQISPKSVDLRGMITSVNLIKKGLSPKDAMKICISSKVFDEYERKIVEDLINLKLPEKLNLQV